MNGNLKDTPSEQELHDMREFCKKHDIKVNELKREKLNFIF